MDKVVGFFVILLGVVAFIAGVCLLLAWPFMWLWNYAVVQAISVTNPITYWPAFWLMLFISLFCVGSRTSSSD